MKQSDMIGPMTTSRVLLSILLLLSAKGAVAQSAAIPTHPPAPSLDPPAPAHLVFSVFATGVQIYRCSVGDTGPQWTFFAPEASLHDSSTASGPGSGSHSAGPTWRWNDGSAIVGKPVGKQAAPDGKSIPWLLLSATDAPGSPPTGRLHGISFVRRSDTDGGAAPATGCDPKHFNAESRIPYTATYSFYR